ncbi:MAG: penicillin-binding protein, partial [Candidatus Solibacter usitatus]|nr:penicillin-binding protein [Candidatus Solibacter usitatus]
MHSIVTRVFIVLTTFAGAILLALPSDQSDSSAAKKKALKNGSKTTQTKSAKPVASKSAPKASSTQGAKAKAPAKKSVTSSNVKAAAFRPVGVKGGPWKEPTFADSVSGDYVDGEDLQVRRAAVDALGPYNGTVVVADPYTGRILSLVNQKLALKSGFQPCSTIKVVAALAALSEGIIDRTTPVRFGRRTSLTLTQALAVSD